MAGGGYDYPLTEKQILDRLKNGAAIFEADWNGKIIGTIEIIRRYGEHSAHIGRFVLDQSMTGKGIGTEVLKAFLDYCGQKLAISEVTLCVFDFNTGAYRCYQRCGFAEEGRVVRPNGWTAVNMRKRLG